MRKLFTILTLLCVSLMGWGTQYCGRVVAATVGETAGQTLTFTASKTGDLETTFILTSSTSTLTTFYTIDVRNAAGGGVTNTNWSEWEPSAGTLTKVVTWTTYPSSNFDIYLVAHRSGSGTDIIGATFTDVDVSVACTSCTDETEPSISAVEVSEVTSNSAVLTITASDPVEEGSGIANYIIKDNGSQIASSSSNVITLTGLTASTPYDKLTVNVVDNCGNTSDAFDVDEFTTLARPSQCEGDLGHFGTWNTKRVHYTIEYLPTTNKIRYEVRGYDTQVLDFCQIQTTSGNSDNLTIANGVAIWKQDAPAAGTEMGILIVFSTDAIGGNEMNAENTSSFTGNNEHLIYYKSHDCEADPEPACAPTTTPNESTIFNDCQIYSILGSDYYSSCGWNGETQTWGGGTASSETIDGREVLHVANSNALYRGFAAHDVSGFSHLHFDVWCAEEKSMTMKLMAYDNGFKEADAVAYTTSKGAWKSVDMALSDFHHSYLNQIQGIYPIGMQKEDIYLTNIYFYKTTDDVSCYETLNLAENKPSEAGYNGGNTEEWADAANDGNEGTRWVTWDNRPTSEEWWYVDLKLNYAINKIEVVWGSDYSTNYILQTRTDAPSTADKADDAAWVTIATVTDAAANSTKTNTFTTATGRYVRLHSLSRSDVHCIRLAELRVFASGYAITDTNAPEITTAEVADDSENINSVKLHLVATDVEDGAVTTFLLNKGDDNWIPIVTNAYDFYTVSDLERGHYSYQVKARDHAGNVSVISTINFDIFNPADNLALHKTVIAGWTNPENPGDAPANATDGVLSTPWASASSGGDRPMSEQWIYVDLGDVYQLSSFDLFWDVRSNHYLIQTAHSVPAIDDDDTQWVTAREIEETQHTGQTEGDKNSYSVNASARYIRMKAITKTGGYLKLWEFRVCGSAFATADVNAPEITAASVSYNLGKVYLTLEASDTEDGTIKTFRVVNTTTGDKQLLTTNGDNQIIIEGLDVNALYEYEIQAMDKAANLSAVSLVTVRIPATAGNIAKNKPVTAGFETGNYWETKEKANDGNPDNFWATWNTGDVSREWIYIDLGGQYDLEKVIIKWGDLVSGNYLLQVRRTAPTLEEAADADKWDNLASAVTDAVISSSKETSVSGIGRYVLLRTNTGNIKIREFEVYANAAVLPFVDDGNNSTSIAANDQAVVNVEFPREILADNTWYTICLPFDLDAAKVNAVFGACTIAQLVDTEDRGSLLHLNFNYVNAIQAGKPYMIKVGNAFTAGSTIENVTIQNIAPVETGDAGMKFIGTFDQKELNQSNQRFVGPDDYLYSPAEGGTTMGAFRCYFTIPDGSPASAPGKRAKIVFAPQQTTDIDQTAEQATPSKFILNGVLYILRDGKTYNAQGLLIQ